MADYTRNAEKAEAELFDGTQSAAEALVLAYEDIVFIQRDENEYPTPTGSVTLDAGTTGVEATITATKDAEDDPMVVEIEVTAPCSTSGDLTFDFFGEEVVVAVLDTDDEGEVAAKIAAATFTGYSPVAALAVVTITQDADAQGDAILAVLDHEGQYLNAYKDTYIVFASGYRIPSTTTIWAKADFELWWTAV